mgnify:CR=1 FL=1
MKKEDKYNKKKINKNSKSILDKLEGKMNSWYNNRSRQGRLLLETIALWCYVIVLSNHCLFN